MQYYLDQDLRQNIFYLAPFGKVQGPSFVIAFDKRFEADNFLRKLNSGMIKGPHEDLSCYEKIGEEVLMKKTLIVFRVKKRAT